MANKSIQRIKLIDGIIYDINDPNAVRSSEKIDDATLEQIWGEAIPQNSGAMSDTLIEDLWNAASA